MIGVIAGRTLMPFTERVAWLRNVQSSTKRPTTHNGENLMTWGKNPQTFKDIKLMDESVKRDKQRQQTFASTVKPATNHEIEMKASSQIHVDDVELHARTISYDVCAGALSISRRDFEVRKCAQSLVPIETVLKKTSVRFTGATKQEALDALQAIIDNIKSKGLPETVLKVSEQQAKTHMAIQNMSAKVSASLTQLPTDQRSWVAVSVTRIVNKPDAHASFHDRFGVKVGDYGFGFNRVFDTSILSE